MEMTLVPPQRGVAILGVCASGGGEGRTLRPQNFARAARASRASRAAPRGLSGRHREGGMWAGPGSLGT